MPATRSKKVEIKKTFFSPESSAHWLDDGHKNFSILAILAKVIPACTIDRDSRSDFGDRVSRSDFF